MLQHSTETPQKRQTNRFIKVDGPEVTEGTLKLPSIDNSASRSVTPQAKKTTLSQLAMPSIEETKFLSMPMKSANREFTRSVSAKKAPRSRLQLHPKQESSRSTVADSTLSSERPDVLQRYVARVKKVKDINHGKWINDVVNQDRLSARAASCASLRAESELHETQSYFTNSANDTVSQIQQTIANMDEDCNRRLEQLAEQARVEAEKEARWNAVLEKRRPKVSSLSRGLAFGNVKNKLDDKVKSEQANLWNSNVQVKKPLMQTKAVAVVAPQRRALSSRVPAASKNVPKISTAQLDNQKELVKRQALLNKVYGDFSYDTCQNDQDYDSEY